MLVLYAVQQDGSEKRLPDSAAQNIKSEYPADWSDQKVADFINVQSSRVYAKLEEPQTKESNEA